MDPLANVLLVVGLVALAAAAFTYYKATRVKAELAVLQQDFTRRLQDQEREAETLRKETLLSARDEAHVIRQAAEQEAREHRAQVQRHEERVASREEAMDRRLAGLERREEELKERDRELQSLRDEGAGLVARQRAELERIGGLSHEDARTLLMKQLEDELRMDAARLIRQVEDETREDADRRARQIIVQAIQRCAVDQVSETTVSVVPLPSDEMKGRIIGREGRNIRAFETLTGVDLIIDDTPEAVVLSAFDPIRRETARLALSNLITDGRIHPGRIEETIAKARDEIEGTIREAGELAVLRAGVSGVHPEVVRTLGKLRYRTSYGQNVLDHSIEVAHLAATLAAELGVDAEVARRAGLLHDLGKAIDYEMEGSHLQISVDLARKHGEAPAVVHAIEAHHGDVDFQSVEAVLVQIADAISASRPGARREMLESYLKRMQRLENVVNGIPGVERTFAVQAGRELRIIVDPNGIDDLGAVRLARDTAKKIEEEMQYPGQIKITVIRESRATEYAR
ncbi:MAG: ribonuclease Y [Actinomycetota bacterium]